MSKHTQTLKHANYYVMLLLLLLTPDFNDWITKLKLILCMQPNDIYCTYCMHCYMHTVTLPESLYVYTHRLASTHTCASHQTFMQLNQLDLKTFHETMSECVFLHCDSYPILTDSGVSDIEQTPCWSELLRREQGRACRTDTHRALMRTSCWEDGSPWRPDVGLLAGVQRRCVFTLQGSCQGRAVCVDHVIEWEKHAGACLTGSFRLWWVFSQRSLVEQWQLKGVLRVDGSNPQTIKYWENFWLIKVPSF